MGVMVTQPIRTTVMAKFDQEMMEPETLPLVSHSPEVATAFTRSIEGQR
jgi:hypothetical protein